MAKVENVDLFTKNEFIQPLQELQFGKANGISAEAIKVVDKISPNWFLNILNKFLGE